MEDLATVLANARAKKLPMTVKEILGTGDKNNVAVLVEFADGVQAACLLPVDMISEENIRVSAAVMAVVWEVLNPPPPNISQRKKRKPDNGEEEVIDLG